jgi:gamma-glutamylcyclotransferase (GGCT)/AIG2-like uncharacterized protein YtfP
MPPSRHLIFVYGTLKRGGTNHGYLAGQQFLAEARTAAGFVLYQLDGYPGLVPDPDAREGVTGELWAVDTACLRQLDALEGTDEGLYVRERITLTPPHDSQWVETYRFARSVVGRSRIGATWRGP